MIDYSLEASYSLQTIYEQSFFFARDVTHSQSPSVKATGHNHFRVLIILIHIPHRLPKFCTIVFSVSFVSHPCPRIPSPSLASPTVFGILLVLDKPATLSKPSLFELVLLLVILT